MRHVLCQTVYSGLKLLRVEQINVASPFGNILPAANKIDSAAKRTKIRQQHKSTVSSQLSVMALARVAVVGLIGK